MHYTVHLYTVVCRNCPGYEAYEGNLIIQLVGTSTLLLFEEVDLQLNGCKGTSTMTMVDLRIFKKSKCPQ